VTDSTDRALASALSPHTPGAAGGLQPATGSAMRFTFRHHGDRRKWSVGRAGTVRPSRYFVNCAAPRGPRRPTRNASGPDVTSPHRRWEEVGARTAKRSPPFAR